MIHRKKRIVAGAKKFDKAPVEPLDYDRLAKCIAKEISAENDRRANARSDTREWMKFITWPIIIAFSILMASLGVGCLIVALKAFGAALSPLTLSMNTLMIFLKGELFFALSLMCIGAATTAFFASKEFEGETDRQFVASVFSSMVSLTALIVAFLALLKG